jgi:hypothetical protein
VAQAVTMYLLLMVDYLSLARIGPRCCVSAGPLGRWFGVCLAIMTKQDVCQTPAM